MKRNTLAVAVSVLAFMAVPALAGTLFSFQTAIQPNDPTFTQLLGINNSRTIAGYFGSGAAGHPNQGLVLSLPRTTTIHGIDDLRQVVGFYVDANTDGFGASTPEPASGMLLGLVLVGLALALRKRQGRIK
jgi:hypothetical protein